MTDRLDAFARRVGDDPAFLASALQAYARSERLDGRALAAYLHCDLADLGRIGLCRRPAGTSLRPQVEAIATRFGLREDALFEVLRRADVLDALRASGAEVMAAARDRSIEEGER